MYLFIVCLLVYQISTVFAIVTIDFNRPALQKCDINHLPPWNRDIEIPPHIMSHNQTFKFRVHEKCATKLPHCMTPCASPMTRVTIPLKKPPQGRLNPEDDAPLIHFTPYGYFRFDSEYFSGDDFCVYSLQPNSIVLNVCPSKCGGEEITHGKMTFSTVCVPKCCSIHKVLDLKTDSCEYTGSKDPWNPLVFRSERRQVCGEKRANLKLHYIQTPPQCDSFQKYFLKSIPGTSRVRFRLLTNGTVLLRELSNLRWTVLEEGTYCLDGVKNYGEGEGFTNDPTDQVLLLCEKVVEDGVGVPNDSTAVTVDQFHQEVRLNVTGIAYIILLFSGVPFLLVTAIVYILVWTKQNVHGWTLFSHTLAMLLHYVAQGVANTVSRILNSDQNASVLCRIVGISNHYFVLASFCWLTIINYDLFSMFRHLKTTVGRSRGMKRFLVYMAIAWGIPFIAVMISVILDKLYGLYGDDGDCEVDVIVPLYGHKTCYMTEDARAYYLYYPVGVLMGINIMLAFMTFINMYKHNETVKMATEENRTRHRRKFSVMAKLFIVMGLVWTFEVVVFMIKTEWETLPWYLIFPDVFNTIQAIAIFVLFACQPKILNQVADSYPKLTPITESMKKLVCKRKKPGGGVLSSSGTPAKYNLQVVNSNP